MTTLTYSETLVAGTNENVNDLNSILSDIQTWANGNVDNTNLSGSAGITDANLASPNNSAYKTIHTGMGAINSAHSTSTYMFVGSGANMSTTFGGHTNDGVGFLYLAAADYAVGGKTTKIRLRVNMLTNSTATTTTFTPGLYPITASSGGGGGLTTVSITRGTVISGSTSVFTTPAATAQYQNDTTSGVVTTAASDVTIPSDGFYVVAVVTSGNAPVANSGVMMSYQLQVRNV